MLLKLLSSGGPMLLNNSRRKGPFLLKTDTHPTVVPEPALGALSPRPEAFGALDDIDSGSPQDSPLDTMPPTGGPDHDA